MDLSMTTSFSSPECIDRNKQNADFLYKELLKTRESYKNIEEIIESLTDGIFITDKNAKALKINRAYESITGVSRDQLLGHSTQLLVERYNFNVSCSVLCSQQKRAITLEQCLRNSGKKVLVSCRPLYDTDGDIRLIIGTIRDITELESLKVTLAKAEEQSLKYREEIDIIKEQLSSHSEIVAADKKMLDTVYMAKKVSSIDASVLLTGETGVGKEEIAKFIHHNSPRREERFMKINCGAIPTNLIESELFGYEKGAFTGASAHGKPGLLEAANKGTVFLDEVGDLPLDMQVKLLRVLQEREVTRIGGINPTKLNIRIISATNRDLEGMIQNKTFRQDLFFRVNIMPIVIPPLRERQGDIMPLVARFLRMANENFNTNKQMAAAAFQLLYEYDWPGNIRELKNCIERAVISSEGDTILPSDIQRILFPTARNDEFCLGEKQALKTMLEQIELNCLNEAYDNHGTVRRAAEILGMTPSTFQRRRRELSQHYKENDISHTPNLHP